MAERTSPSRVESEMRRRLLSKRKYIEFSPTESTYSKTSDRSDPSEESSTNSSRLSENRDLRSVLFSKKSFSTPRTRVTHTSPHNYRKRLSFNDQVVKKTPMFQNHQLLGDSQFVRFSEQMLSMSREVTYTSDTNSRHIGNCVSGQKIEDLKNRLENINYNIHSHVIMMIGTNDILYRTTVEDMCKSYDELLSKLKEKCEKIVLLTIPPVAKLEKFQFHWDKLETFNKFIQKKANNKQIFVVDICTIFISYNNTVDLDYFEKSFSGYGKRPDLIHLNSKGFYMLKACLETKYFNEH